MDWTLAVNDVAGGMIDGIAVPPPARGAIIVWVILGINC